MTDFIAQVLAWLYGIWPSYAGAIVLLTLLIMLAVTPLTLKGTRSMMQMQKLQPELRKIQAQYRDDRQRLNEELMAFYKENGINPMGGCLPLLIQMPVFFALYGVLRGLTRRVSDMGFDVGWAAGQQAQGISKITAPPANDLNFDPAYIKHDSSLYESLSSTNVMQSWGLDLSESASKALGEGIVHALPYFLLIAVVAVTGVVQQRQIQGRNPNAEVNPQQQMIMKFMPIMLPVISFTLPSGLVLYFAVSNTYRVGQQWWISRSIYGITPDGADSQAVIDVKSQPSGKASGKASTKSPGKGEATSLAKDADETRSRRGDRPSGRRTLDVANRESTGDSKAKQPSKRSGGGRTTPAKTRATSATDVSKSADAKSAPTPPTAQPRARKKKR